MSNLLNTNEKEVEQQTLHASKLTRVLNKNIANYKKDAGL